MACYQTGSGWVGLRMGRIGCRHKAATGLNYTINQLNTFNKVRKMAKQISCLRRKVTENIVPFIGNANVKHVILFKQAFNVETKLKTH